MGPNLVFIQLKFVRKIKLKCCAIPVSISGSSDISRIAFILSFHFRTKWLSVQVPCSENCMLKENILKAFSATGVIPYYPNKIDFSHFPSSLAGTRQSGSPKTTSSLCRLQDIELHPLIKQGVILKHPTQIFTYPLPSKPKIQYKVVKNKLVLLHQSQLNQKYSLLKTNEKGSNSFKTMLGGNTHLFEAKSKSKTPHILKEWGNISEMSDDESSKDNKSALVNFQLMI